MEKKRSTIYLDYAAATPVRHEVLEAMLPYFSEHFGNPSALYKEGVYAKHAIEEERRKLARTLSIREEGIVFTSGGTEANRLAITGTIRAYHSKHNKKLPEIITVRTEHPSILKTLSLLESEQRVRVFFADVTEKGLIDLASLESFLSPCTALVTVAYVNSEIGVIQPLKKISRMVKRFAEKSGVKIPIHTDASQAPLWLSCALDSLGVDLMTLDGAKCYGPKGMGVLARMKGIQLSAEVRGGSQESGLRAGTENVPLIVGGVKAILMAQANIHARSARVLSLRDRCFDRLIDAVSGIQINGDRNRRVANNVNISIPGVDTEFLTLALDSRGICIATKSACGGKEGNGSAVVRACTHDDARSLSTLRITLGEQTTEEEIDRVVQSIGEEVRNQRQFKKEFGFE